MLGEPLLDWVLCSTLLGLDLWVLITLVWEGLYDGFCMEGLFT